MFQSVKYIEDLQLNFSYFSDPLVNDRNESEWIVLSGKFFQSQCIFFHKMALVLIFI